MPKQFRLICALSCALVLFPSQALAQNEVPSVTRAFAIQGATVVTAPGRVLENATVVVRNGLIEAVGTSVAIPYDARVIKGDSLFVYYGFIDGLGYIGVPAPRSQGESDDAAVPGRGQQERVDDPGNPGNERAGIQPERFAADELDNKDKSVADYRKAGVAIAHAVPRGRMLPGSGAIVSLASDVESGVMTRRSSMFMQFEGASGAYPGTPMAIMAKFRNLYRQAELEKGWDANYRLNPSGIQRPPGNPVHGAFNDVIDRKLPVVVLSNDILTTYRALRLQKELGFNVVLAGVGQAADMIQELADSGKPILLTLKLPDEVKKERSTTGAAEADSTKKPVEAKTDTMTAYNADLRTLSYADVDAETANLKARKNNTRIRYIEAAAALEKAGVPFGFTTADISAKDFRPNVLKMVEVGLSEDAALAALTTNPAKILGIDKATGTIEAGKMANIVVSSGSYFKEKSFVQYMIVDGELYAYEAPSKKSTKSADADAAAGTWRYLTSIEGEDYGGTFTLTNDGGTLSGTISGDDLPETNMNDIEFDGSTLSFTFEVPELGTTKMTATIDGDSGSAEIELPGIGTFQASLRRTASPE